MPRGGWCCATRSPGCSARYGVKTIVDLATLTGAMIVALGHEHGGLFSNDDTLAGAA